MVREFLASGKKMACAYPGYPANPAVFRSDMLPELLALAGDSGPRRILAKQDCDVHHYVVSPGKLADVDTREDLDSSLLSVHRIDRIYSN
jgi:CTP:molybdopterin cytidylyltransferase MocA